LIKENYFRINQGLFFPYPLKNINYFAFPEKEYCNSSGKSNKESGNLKVPILFASHVLAHLNQ